MSSDSDPSYLEHPLIWPRTVEARRYQQVIADAAADRNTLVILPTALGKTVIAALVAAHVLYDYRDTKVLVMAPTRPLVLQHRRRFAAMLKLGAEDTAVLTGLTPPVYREPIWAGATRILFSTPQVVNNDVAEKRLTLDRYSLLVVDECHRAVKNYAYTSIAKSYLAQAEYPRILGMTASPGSDPQRVLNVCRNLFIEHIEYRTEDATDVQPYLQPIAMEWRRVDLPPDYVAMTALIRRMLHRRLRWLQQRRILRSSPVYASRRSLIEAGDQLRRLLEERPAEERGGLYTAIVNQSLALTLFHMLELLESQGLWTLNTFLSKVAQEAPEKRSYAVLVKEPEYQQLLTAIDRSHSDHPKTVLLQELVHDTVAAKPSARLLVFAQYRATARHLVTELNTIPGVRASRFVGQASTLLDEGLTQEEQAARIEQLEDGSLNVLVATSIAEEGLDIPAVDQVVFYEPIPSEIRYIQRRGRTGRKAPGKVTILATNNSLDMAYLYASSRRIEKMQRIVETVNRKLHPIIRLRPKPPLNRLTPAELQAIEDEAQQVRRDPDVLKTEAEALKTVRVDVAQATRKAYTTLLEKGKTGIRGNQLTWEMGLDGVNPATASSALRKLIDDQLVKEGSPGTYVATATVQPAGQTVDITIEKIVPGSAVVLIDSQWRAVLLPDDYNGPRHLIKKGSRFRAAAHLYHIDGTPYLRVKAVTETLP